MRNKIEQSNFKMIESELYYYQETKTELRILQEEILEEGAFQEVAVQSGKTGDSTANKAIKLMTGREILEIRKRLNAIEKTIDILKCGDEKKLKLLEMKYFERKYTDEGIANKLFIDRATFYRWRKEIILLIANYLGYKI